VLLRPAPAAVYVPLNDWTGFYVGISGGYGFGNSTFVATGAFATELANAVPTASLPTDSMDHHGGIVGGQAGFNYQFANRFVLGAVADWSWADIKGSVCVEKSTTVRINNVPVTTGHCDGSPDNSFAKAKISWLATFRGNLGFAPTNDLLAYLTGGFAVAGIEGRITHLTSGTDPDVTDKATLTGFAAGGGVKYKFARSWSIGAEYIYVHLGKHGYTFTNPAVSDAATVDAKTHLDIIRGSLSYEFGNSNPIVTKY